MNDPDGPATELVTEMEIKMELVKATLDLWAAVEEAERECFGES